MRLLLLLIVLHHGSKLPACTSETMQRLHAHIYLNSATHFYNYHTVGRIENFDCKQSFCPNINQTIVCTTEYQTLRWMISGYDQHIDFYSGNSIGQVFNEGPFSATLVSKSGQFTSRLSFTGSASVSGTTITCYDGSDGDSEQCTVEIGGKEIIK